MSESEAAAFTGSVNLASSRLGARVLLASDEFFAEKENLIAPGRGVFLPHEYTDRGKWMDGWESRRKRVPGHDFCIVRLGVNGLVEGVDIDTNHFLGNHPPHASIDACLVDRDTPPEALRDAVEWIRILPAVALKAGSQNLFAVSDRGPFSHVRLNIYPDGGVARLVVYGRPSVTHGGVGAVDLAGVLEGGRAVACSDMFFGSMNNLVLPGRAENMGGGWETRRRRTDGNDWIIVALGRPGLLDEVEIDTAHFKGNHPDRCRLRGIAWPGADAVGLIASRDWIDVLGEKKLGPDKQHVFQELEARGPFTHLRLDIYPCGGVSRLRARGRASDARAGDRILDGLNAGSEQAVVDALSSCCGSSRWARALARKRPFASRAHLFGEARSVWWHLGDGDWLEAFAHHPKIGSNVDELRKRFQGTAAWAEAEQGGVRSATDDVLKELALKNIEYEVRFGFIFIVCATGKSAPEMLEILKARLGNARENELRIAAGEQEKITRLRLEKLEFST
jgi:allantoicase